MMINSLKNTGNQVSFTNSKILHKALSHIDYSDWNTPRYAVMALYTGCILSRLACSRDKYEFKETLTRDSLGWTSLFLASLTSEKVIAWTLEKLNLSKRAKELNMPELKEKGTSLFLGSEKKFPSLWEAIKFRSPYKLRTFKDIDFIENKQLQKYIKTNKVIAYTASLLFAIAALGIAIPWLNVITTRHLVKEENKKQNTNLNSTQNHVSSGLNITMKEFLKLSSPK